MRKIVVEVPEDCNNCPIARAKPPEFIYAHCPFRRSKVWEMGKRVRPVKACRDAEIKEAHNDK